MGKQAKRNQPAPSSKPSKHKPIAQLPAKPSKDQKKPAPPGKQLFQIINETEGGEDPFAALPFDEEEEEVPVKQSKSNKNKFKKQQKEVTPEESEEEQEIDEE